jgi:hypothetical protein
MPFKSTAQQRWANSPAGVKALGGEAKVHEWNEATKQQPGGFKALPGHVHKQARSAAARRMAAKFKGGKR